MRYLVRSIKYFISYMVFLAVILLLLILFGAADWDFSTLFRDGKDSLWKIAALFAAVAAVYPKIGFTARTFTTQAGKKEIMDTAVAYMKQLGYAEEKGYTMDRQGQGSVSFRQENFISRLSRMYEDRIIITAGDGTVTIEGLRKDVVRICGGLEFRMNTEDRQ